MAGRPTISVLIPTYNRASFLPETLGSVFAQTVPVDEVFLVDDGSTDDTAHVVERLLEEHPGWKGRLHFLQQENQGKSVALNNALRLARGEWIAFNDSDDAWMPEKLEWQFRALAEFPECRVCFVDCSFPDFPEKRGILERARQRHPRRFGPKKGPLGKVKEPSWLFCGEWPDIYLQSAVVHESVLRQCGPFDPLLRIEQDVDMLFRLGLITGFCYVDRPLVEIHRDPNRTLGLTTSFPSRSSARLKTEEARLRKWSPLVPEADSALRQAIRHAFASNKSEVANRYVLAGDLPSARQALKEGLRESVEMRLIIKWLMTYTMPAFLRRIAIRRFPQGLSREPRHAAIPPPGGGGMAQ